jgi:hypothetical protein
MGTTTQVRWDGVGYVQALRKQQLEVWVVKGHAGVCAAKKVADRSADFLTQGVVVLAEVSARPARVLTKDWRSRQSEFRLLIIDTKEGNDTRSDFCKRA